MGIIDLLISTASFALFFYWFQYVCLLILSAKTSSDYSADIATANQLGFPEVQSTLRGGGGNLERLHRRLENDYAIITDLLKRTPGLIADDHREMALLRIHYRTMSAWFWLTRGSLHDAAAQALEEMSLVLVYLANTIGERTGNGDGSGCIYPGWKPNEGSGCSGARP